MGETGLFVYACGPALVMACADSKGFCPCLFLLAECEVFKSKDRVASFPGFFITCKTEVKSLPVKCKTLPKIQR